ncbi:MAG: histidine phosphatase family protein [Planctomycetota bacterium]
MAKKAQIDLLLVRSGRTEWEEAGRLQGQADLPLSPTGREVVLANLRHLLAGDDGADVSVVLTSPDEASQETGQLLGERIESKQRPISGLQAFNLGLWEGLLEDDLIERYPRAYKQWREDPSSVHPPEGETFVAGEVRVLMALLKAVEKATGTAVAVVVRPMEYGILRALASGRSTSDVWLLVEDGPAVERLPLQLSTLRERIESLKASA